MHFLVRFLKMKFCTLTIQRRWRATLAARMVRLQFLATKNAVVKIQLAYRQYRARRLLRKVRFHLLSMSCCVKFASLLSEFCHRCAEEKKKGG